VSFERGVRVRRDRRELVVQRVQVEAERGEARVEVPGKHVLQQGAHQPERALLHRAFLRVLVQGAETLVVVQHEQAPPAHEIHALRVPDVR
jgi:hypothetical protein